MALFNILTNLFLSTLDGSDEKNKISSISSIKIYLGYTIYCYMMYKIIPFLLLLVKVMYKMLLKFLSNRKIIDSSKLIKDYKQLTYLSDRLKNSKDIKYALITGCTEGIGKEYTNLFSQLNYNLILISRNPDKLSKLKQDISEKNPNLEIIIIEFDFSKNNRIHDYKERIIDVLFNNIDGESGITIKDIAFVINNVGIYYGAYVKEIENNKELFDYININIISCVCLTKLLIDEILKYNYSTYNSDIKKNKDTICFINMSSISAEIPDPSNSIYSASKRFVDIFTKKMQIEMNNLYNSFQNNSSICMLPRIFHFSIKPSYISTAMVPIDPDYTRVVSTNEHCFEVMSKILNIIKTNTCLNSKYSSEIFGVINHELESIIINNFPEFIFRKILEYDHNNY